ncbi:ABC transporter permease, partial [Streptomyces sp. MBT57]|nr:ABC transporter permease [Streptomyces sp. MBT57]
LGKYTGWELMEAYAFQGAWAVALLLAGRLLQGVATRRVVVQGG